MDSQQIEHESTATSQATWFGAGYDWESVLSSVKVPSLDSDEDSLSDCELEDVKIFQREDCLVLDLPEELLCEETEFMNKDVSLPDSVQTTNVLEAISNVTSQVAPDISSLAALQYDTEEKPEDAAKEAPPPRKTKVTVDECHKLHGVNPLATVTRQSNDEADDQHVRPVNGHLELDPLNVVPTQTPSRCPKLTEHGDLEIILQRLTDEGIVSDAGIEPVEKAPISLPSVEKSVKKRQDQIMEQLVELSARQSQTIAPGNSHRAPLCSDSPNRIVSNRSDLIKMETNSCKEYSENIPTIFIDLRASSSPTNSKIGADKPEKLAHKELTEEELPQNRSGLTGKSALLRQLRHMKTRPHSDPPGQSNQQPITRELEHVDRSAFRQTRRTQKLRDRVNVGPSAPQILEERQEKECELTGQESKKEETEEITQEPPGNTQNDCSSSSTDQQGQKDRHEKERRSRQRMQTQLEGMKPRSSVNGHQPMAENTPVLFHPEASYCSEIDTLPVSGGTEMLLLTVRLSSCGQVTKPGQHSGHCPVSALSLANTYHTLLVWLLSLVLPLNPHCQGEAPFQVLGLQQVWREEGLALYACISPHDGPVTNTPKTRKHKGKDDHRGTSTFYQQTSSFLSHNTLHSITWWREAVMQQLLGQVFPLSLEVPAVRLSNIVMMNPDPQAVEKVFPSSSGFFWQTLETEERLSSLPPEFPMDSEMEVVSVVLFDTLLRDSVAFHHALHLILTAGLDICGLRLLYPESSTLQSKIDVPPPITTGGDGKVPPVLTLALRGLHAGKVWGNIAGPCDPQLARLTDPNSLNALYGHTRENLLLYYSRTSGWIWRDLSLWFGGRIPSSGNVKVGIQNPPGRSTQHRSHSPIEKGLPPAMLTATTRGDVFLAVSPIVPPHAYGDIIDTCYQRGFHLCGIRRLRFSAKRAAMLNMSPSQLSVFCPEKPSPQPQPLSCTAICEPRLHCLLLLLRKENAGHHTPALVHGLMNDLAEQGLLGVIRTNLTHLNDLHPSLCFHTAPYTDTLLQGLGGSFHAVPDPSSVALNMLSRQPFTSDLETEQVVTLTVTGGPALHRAGHLLRQILRPPPKKQEASSAASGPPCFELLGLKWLPCLSRLQAKEMTPYEVGDRLWRASVDQLTSSPALVCALRHVQAFTALASAIKELVPATGKLQGQIIMSATPVIAFRQAALIFTDRDLVADQQSRPVLKYIAPPGIYCRSGGNGDHRGQTESIFTYMLSGPPLLYTVLILKPRTWSRHLGKILHKIGHQRFILVGLKIVNLTEEDSFNIIPSQVKQNNALCRAHSDYLTSAPCLVLCLRRLNAVLKLLDLLGPDEPGACKAQDQFLWRAQYGVSDVQNGMYGSMSYQAAIRDIKRFFPEGLVCDHQSVVMEAEQISVLTRDVLFSSREQRQTQKNLLGQLESSQPIDLQVKSALCQTTCLLFPSRALGGSSPAYIQGVEQLIGQEFYITGARLTVFDQSQAQFVAELYSLKDSLSAEFKVLMEGPCLLIAAQRDNAVTCLHSLMASVNLQNGQNFGQLFLSPQTQSQANKMISCFFDSLTPDSIHQIVPQAS